MRIGNWDSDSGHVFIIAEIGTNHGGNFQRAIAMQEQAAATGVDAVKFQIYNADKLVDPSMPAMVPSHKTQLERMRSLQLTHDQYRELAKRAEAFGVVWTASAFDEESVDLVVELSPCIKIASGEALNINLMRYAADKGKPLIISTGMIGRSELVWQPPAAFWLHCLSLYPAPFEGLFLKAVDKGDGYSDHTIGTLACFAAVARGAKIIEKHFTDLPPEQRDIPGDHRLSLDKFEMAQMVRDIRNIEKMLRPWIGERPDAVNRPLLRRDPVTGLRMGKR